MRKYRIVLLGLCTFALLISIFTLVSSSAANLPPSAHTVYKVPADTPFQPMRSYGQVVENLDHWVLAYEMSQAQAAYQAAAERQRVAEAAQADRPTPAPTSPSYGAAGVPGALSFGLFPCIEMAESGNRPYIHSGLYGDLDSTWAGYDGYPYAGAAPLSVQNAFNLALYNKDGWRPWNDPCTGT